MEEDVASSRRSTERVPEDARVRRVVAENNYLYKTNKQNIDYIIYNLAKNHSSRKTYI